MTRHVPAAPRPGSVPDWDSLVAALAELGVVEPDHRGLAVSFTDARGDERRVVVMITPDEWIDLLDFGGIAETDAAAEVVQMLRGSDPEVQALIATHDYNVVLAPYLPPTRP